jgi:hypothetical protein
MHRKLFPIALLGILPVDAIHPPAVWRQRQPSRRRVREYGEWARRLAASGTEVSGEKLADDSELLVGAPIDTPSRADLRGFFIVQASDAQHAEQLAVSHPHVKRGGTIVVRRIDPT